MIMTNEQIFEGVTVLAQANEKGMLGYAIARNRQKLTAEIQDYAQKRDELITEFGTDVGNGRYQLTPEGAVKFSEALRPYGELTVEVPIMQVAPEVFYGGDLTSAQMYALSWMVKEE